MSPTPAQLAAVFAGAPRIAPSDASDYHIVGTIEGSAAGGYLGRSRQGNASLLLPLASPAQASPRLTSGLSFRASRCVVLEFGDRRAQESVAAVECTDESLLRTFSVVVASLADELLATGRPTWPKVASALEQWERLLRRRHVLDAPEELGLWGELWLLARTSAPDALLEAWRGPEDGHLDFVLDRRGFEVKTSLTAGYHYISHTQVDPPLDGMSVYFLSLHAIQDATAGRSLPELAALVRERCSDETTFQKYLLEVGYDDRDAGAYTRRYRLASAPFVFPYDAIPRVRTVDPGVTDLRYRIRTDAQRALGGSHLTTVLDALGISTIHDLDP